MVGKQVTIDVDAVRTLTAAARHDLTGGAPVHRLAGSVSDGGSLLQHRAATAALGTAAVRLRERLDTLRALVGQLADAVDASVTAMDTMDSGNAHKFDQISVAEDGVTQGPRGWASRLHPEEEWNSGEAPPADWPEVDEAIYLPVSAETLNAEIGGNYGDGMLYLAQEQVQAQLTANLGSAGLGNYGTAAEPLGSADAVLVYVPGDVQNATQLGLPFTIAQVVPEGPEQIEAARENLATAEARLRGAGMDEVVLLGTGGNTQVPDNMPGAAWSTSGTFEGEGVLDGALIAYRLAEPGVYEVRVYWDNDAEFPSQQDVYAVATMTEEPVADPITGELINAPVNVLTNIIGGGPNPFPNW